MHLWDAAACSAANGAMWPIVSGGSDKVGLSYSAVAISQLRVAAGDSSGAIAVQPFEPYFQMQAALGRVYNVSRLSSADKVEEFTEGRRSADSSSRRLFCALLQMLTLRIRSSPRRLVCCSRARLAALLQGSDRARGTGLDVRGHNFFA